MWVQAKTPLNGLKRKNVRNILGVGKGPRGGARGKRKGAAGIV